MHVLASQLSTSILVSAEHERLLLNFHQFSFSFDLNKIVEKASMQAIAFQLSTICLTGPQVFELCNKFSCFYTG